jgi:hypothetical protein
MVRPLAIRALFIRLLLFIGAFSVVRSKAQKGRKRPPSPLPAHGGPPSPR